MTFRASCGTGLDSFQAQNVMEALWNLANNGRSVVSTIHQPRSSIYSMFDALLLLSEGMTVYFGPANQAVSALFWVSLAPSGLIWIYADEGGFWVNGSG